MKTNKLISVLMLMFLIIGFSACKKSGDSNAKSSSLTVKAIAKISGSKGGSVSIASAYVNIVNLQIEENSGNDGEDVGGGNNDTGENEGGNDAEEGSENDNEDIVLTGPYSLDISSGTASIGQVSVYAGTFKKVDFSFQSSTNPVYKGGSIFISGTFTDSNGTATPFKVYSAFSQQIQLPLAGNGVTVAANTTANINIVFDVNSWLAGIDLSNATVSNGEILIDSSHNATLLTAFEANLSKYIDAEKE